MAFYHSRSCVPAALRYSWACALFVLSVDDGLLAVHSRLGPPPYVCDFATVALTQKASGASSPTTNAQCH